MKWRRAIAAWIVSLTLLGSSGVARADDDSGPSHDARIEGYNPNAEVLSNGTAMIWLLFAFLTVVGLASLFKDAKRTHLD